MRPIQVEIVMPLLTAPEFTCRRCSPIFEQLEVGRNYRSGCQDDFPEDWKQDMDRLSGWIEKARGLYRHRIAIRLIDAQSPSGIWKQLRHRVFKMPAFIVNGRETCTGWNTDTLESLIDEQIRQACVRLEQEEAGTR